MCTFFSLSSNSFFAGLEPVSTLFGCPRLGPGGFENLTAPLRPAAGVSSDCVSGFLGLGLPLASVRPACKGLVAGGRPLVTRKL